MGELGQTTLALDNPSVTSASLSKLLRHELHRVASPVLWILSLRRDPCPPLRGSKKMGAQNGSTKWRQKYLLFGH